MKMKVEDKFAFACFVPHPPLLVPMVGKGKENEISTTLMSVKKLSQQIVESKTETVIFMGPHGPVFKDALSVFVGKKIAGNMKRFGATNTNIEISIDEEIADEIKKGFTEKNIPLAILDDNACEQYSVEKIIDHAIFVPLFYLLEAGFKGKIVYLPMGHLPYGEIYKAGQAIIDILANLERKTAFVISGDLSHALKKGAPADYSENGIIFDTNVMASLITQDVKILNDFSSEFIKSAAECGLRPAFFFLGLLSRLKVSLEMLSYEGPFGVGYGVVTYKILGLFNESMKNRVESELCKLARESLYYFLTNKKPMPVPSKISDELKKKAGVFVCFKKEGSLRGCVGTFLGTRENIASEIIFNAISAGTRDGRFLPITLDEMEHLTVTVDVLEEPEKIKDIGSLDPKKYGVIVRKGNKSGTLLPDLEGIDTVEQQVTIAMQKAGISDATDIEYSRYEVKRYK